MEHTILVVEDDSQTRFLYSELLGSEGHEVLEAADGFEALELFRKNGHVQLVLLDLSIPKMSSAEFIKELRTIERGARVPVIVVSGWHDLAERAKEMGAQDHLTKPMDLEQLLGKVSTYLTKQN